MIVSLDQLQIISKKHIPIFKILTKTGIEYPIQQFLTRRTEFSEGSDIREDHTYHKTDFNTFVSTNLVYEVQKIFEDYQRKFEEVANWKEVRARKISQVKEDLKIEEVKLQIQDDQIARHIDFGKPDPSKNKERKRMIRHWADRPDELIDGILDYISDYIIPLDTKTKEKMSRFTDYTTFRTQVIQKNLFYKDNEKYNTKGIIEILKENGLPDNLLSEHLSPMIFTDFIIEMYTKYQELSDLWLEESIKFHRTASSLSINKDELTVRMKVIWGIPDTENQNKYIDKYSLPKKALFDIREELKTYQTI